MKAGLVTLPQIRSSIGAFANGDNLVTVAATSTNPDAAQRMAKATIEAYVQSVVDSSSSQGTAAVTFYDGLITTYKTAVDDANNALNTYVNAHPVSALGTRTADEQSELTRLTAAVTQAQTQYDSAASKRQDAELSVEQTKADVGQRLRVVDEPQMPSSALSGLKSKIMSMATFVVLGLLLAGGALVLEHAPRPHGAHGDRRPGPPGRPPAGHRPRGWTRSRPAPSAGPGQGPQAGQGPEAGQGEDQDGDGGARQASPGDGAAAARPCRSHALVPVPPLPCGP